MKKEFIYPNCHREKAITAMHAGHGDLFNVYEH